MPPGYGPPPCAADHVGAAIGPERLGGMAYVRHAVRMKPLPLPLRVAAGLAVTAAERARGLPKDLVGLPVTVASQALQFTMRLQQHVTELAIKGDEALSALRPAEEAPSWATFDEDLPPVEPTPADASSNGHSRAGAVRDVTDLGRDPWEEEERALAEDHTDGEFDSAAAADNAATTADAAAGGTAPAAEPNYDQLTLPQLRARLRRFTLEELEELLAYERVHENRPSFVGMLARRIGNVQRTVEGDGRSES